MFDVWPYIYLMTYETNHSLVEEYEEFCIKFQIFHWHSTGTSGVFFCFAPTQDNVRIETQIL